MLLSHRPFDPNALVAHMVNERLSTAALARRLRISVQYARLVIAGVTPGPSFRRRLALAFPGVSFVGHYITEWLEGRRGN